MLTVVDAVGEMCLVVDAVGGVFLLVDDGCVLALVDDVLAGGCCGRSMFPLGDAVDEV